MERALRLLALLGTAACLAGCGGDDDERAAHPAWEGPPPPAADGTIAVDGFNEHVSASEASWTRAPLLVGAEFLRLDAREPSPTDVALDLPPEGAEAADLTVTFEGLLDDSVRAERFELALGRQPDGSWRLASARRLQRCHAGRGHQDFSPERCV